MRRTYTSEPGWITSYDEDTSMASVQPALQQRYVDEDGEFVSEAKPIIQAVRVWSPGGKMLWKPKKGDPGQLLFCSGSLDGYNPRASRPSRSDDDRMHHLTDAIFLPGFQTDFTELPDDDQLILKWNQVLLGRGSRSRVARQVDFENFLDELNNAATAAGATPLGAALAGVATALGLAIAAMAGKTEAT